MYRVTKAGGIDMLRKKLVLGVVIVGVVGTIALAQTSDNSSDRYSIEKRDGGTVRVDKKTGEVSFCDVKNSNVVCRIGADERAAYEVEIESLNNRIALLEKKVEHSLSRTKRPEEGVPGIPREQSRLDKEFDRAMDFAETAMRRFFKIVQDIKKDFQSSET